MALRRLAKDSTSSKNGCPAVCVDDENLTVMTVQGPDPGTVGLIEVNEGEYTARLGA